MTINLHPKSSYSWEDFLESSYYENVIEQLHFVIKESMVDYFFEFFLFNNTFKGKIICSNPQAKNRILLLLCDEANLIKENEVSGYSYIFKSYLPDAHSSFIPIPVGFNSRTPFRPIKIIEGRSINVFFSGNLNSNRLTGIYKSLHSLRFISDRLFLFIYNRPRLQKLLRISFPTNLSDKFKNSLILFTQQFNSGIDPQSYANYLNDSKIVLCPKGYVTTETFRIYEALRQGCIVITEELPKHEFYVNGPIIELKNWNELEKIMSSLEDCDLTNHQRKSIDFYKNNLSENAVAKLIVKYLETHNE